MWMWPMMGGWGMMPWWGALIMTIFWAVIVAGIVVFIVWIVRNISAHAPTQAGQNRALELLKERYARGELTRDEYLQMRHDLEG